MLSATLERSLRTYGIGDKLRGLRLSKKMGLVELGRHTGLSAALLSKIERGRLFLAEIGDAVGHQQIKIGLVPRGADFQSAIC